MGQFGIFLTAALRDIIHRKINFLWKSKNPKNVLNGNKRGNRDLENGKNPKNVLDDIVDPMSFISRFHE